MANPQVMVYRVGDDGSTAEFLAYGSLLDRSIVFVHPEPESTPSPRPGGPRPRPRPRRTFDVDAQRLTAAPLLSTPSGLGRARCQLLAADGVITVIDGTLQSVQGTDPALVAVGLDVAYEGEAEPSAIPFTSRDPAVLAAAVSEVVGAAAALDPPQVLLPPPTAPAPTTPDDELPGVRPWYCWICPGAPGCK